MVEARREAAEAASRTCRTCDGATVTFQNVSRGNKKKNVNCVPSHLGFKRIAIRKKKEGARGLLTGVVQ